jgi:hypothetical protein
MKNKNEEGLEERRIRRVSDGINMGKVEESMEGQHRALTVHTGMV